MWIFGIIDPLANNLPTFPRKYRVKALERGIIAQNHENDNKSTLLRGSLVYIVGGECPQHAHRDV